MEYFKKRNFSNKKNPFNNYKQYKPRNFVSQEEIDFACEDPMGTLDKLGFSLAKTSDGSMWGMFNCCFHPDNKPSLAINKETGGYFCHACQAKGGSIINFVEELNKKEFIEAVQYINELKGAFNGKY